MSSFHIKLLAIIFMVIDHVGLFFYPHIFVLRLIGRLAFPLFCWLIATGASHTKNINRYMLRLGIFALISQLPFTLANQLYGSTGFYLNVLFTLCLGLVAISFINKTNDWRLRVIITMLAGAVAQGFNTDYGAGGVISVVLFYIFRSDFKKMVAWQVALYAAQLVVVSLAYHYASGMFPTNLVFYFEPVGLLSLFILYRYNGQRGWPAKYLFYIFYPVQYLIILAFSL